MLVKQVDRSPSFLAWCPIPGKGNLIAAATREGTLDENFQSHNSIHLFNTKFDNDCNLNIPSVGVVETQQSFTAIAWGKSVAAAYDCGLIAGGMNDGSLTFWDPNQLTSGSAKMKDAIIHTEKVHSEPITSLDFNKSMPKYLASGSLDGKVYIWDLSNPLAPNHQLPPSGESSLNDRKRITAVAWNCTVPYILSSSNAAGETSIWDLRNKRLAITFRSRSMQSATAVAWNPSNARQLVVSYDSNVAEIWDLRQFISPKAFLEGGHQRSILDVSWCPQDSNMLLTTGDDNKAILWNEQGHLMHEIPFENDSNFIAEWSPQKPGVLATCSFRGQIGVHSVQWCGSEHVPKWIKKPAGVNFGFGGRVVAFKEVKGASPKLDMYKLDCDPTVGKNAEELASLLQNNNQETLQKFANSKVEGAETEEEKTIWEMINLFYANDFKNALFDYFGFPKGKDEGQPGAAKKKVSIKKKKKPVVVKEPEDDLDDGAFFDRLGSCNDLKGAGEKLKDVLAKASAVVDEPVVEQPDSPSSPASLSNIGVCDPKVREALVTRNFALAVELSLSRNRIADALVFAKHGGAELWDETCSKFLSAHDDSFIRNLFQPVSERNFAKMVEKSDANEWKQTLCMILSYASDPQEANQFITELGKKLTTVGHLIPAMSCFIVATDLPRLFGIWGDLMSESHGDHHPMIEKIFSISNAPNVQMKQGDREAVAKCYGEYANYLVAEGHVQVAAQFLMVTKQSIDSGDVNELLHRINEAHPELGIFPNQQHQKKTNRNPNTGNRRPVPKSAPKVSHNTTQRQPTRQPSTSRKVPPSRNNGPQTQPSHNTTRPGSTRKQPPRNPQPERTRQPVRGPPERAPQPTSGRSSGSAGRQRPAPGRNPAPARNPPGRRVPPGRNPQEPVASRIPPARSSPNTRHPPATKPSPARKAPSRMPPSRGQPKPSSDRAPSRGDPAYPQNNSSRNPPRKGVPQQKPQPYGQPPARGSVRRQPGRTAAPAPNQQAVSRKKVGGFFGQQSSAKAYTGQTEADSRNVLDNLNKIITDIEQSGRLNPMQGRQLRNSRNRVTQIQGLLSNRQLTPQSYEKLADIVDSLLNKNCNGAMNIQNQIQGDKNLRNTSRTWVPALKTLTNLARIVYN